MIGTVAEFIEVLKTLPQEAQMYAWNVEQRFESREFSSYAGPMFIDIRCTFAADDVALSDQASVFIPKGLPSGD